MRRQDPLLPISPLLLLLPPLPPPSHPLPIIYLHVLSLTSNTPYSVSHLMHVGWGRTTHSTNASATELRRACVCHRVWCASLRGTGTRRRRPAASTSPRHMACSVSVLLYSITLTLTLKLTLPMPMKYNSPHLVTHHLTTHTTVTPSALLCLFTHTLSLSLSLLCTVILTMTM